MSTANDTRIAGILQAAGLGLMPEVNSAIQVRALLNSAGMRYGMTPRVDVSKTRKGQRFRVHVGGHDPRVDSPIGTATQLSILSALFEAGCKDILIDRLNAGDTHPHHALSQMGGRNDPAPLGQAGFFIEFFS